MILPDAIQPDKLANFKDPFLLEKSWYKRDIDVLEGSKQDIAHYVSKRLNISKETALEKITDLRAGKGPEAGKLVDPDVLHLRRDSRRSDRVLAVTTMSKYIEEATEQHWLITPTMTIYENPHVEASFLSGFTQKNVDARAVIKKQKFNFQRIGDHQAAIFADIRQVNKKTSNNSLSGAHASRFTMLFNRSAHSVLTSTTRTAASIANLNNEKFFAGSRLYFTPDVTIANIAAASNLIDRDAVEACIRDFDLHVPTDEELMEAVLYSSRIYWKSPEYEEQIRQYIAKLDDVERVGFLYSGDLYHLAIYNRDLVYNFIDGISEKSEAEIKNPDDWMKALDGDLAILVGYICNDITNNVSVWDLKKKVPEAFNTAMATTRHICNTLEWFAPIIRAFWCNRLAPSSVSSAPIMVRRVVVASDTDSTIFTLQWWTKWFYGERLFNRKTAAIRDSLTYIASRNIIHYLAMMSANIGVLDKHLNAITMKNEFIFPTIATTNRAKHYYAYQGACEGVVYEEQELEIKGVAFKASKAPDEIVRWCHDKICDVMDRVQSQTPIYLKEEMTEIADIERRLFKSLRSGEEGYLKSAEIKHPKTYKNGEAAPAYQQHLLWNYVFGPKYGTMPEPPYSGIKINLKAKNKTEFQEWLNGMEDKSIPERLRKFLLETKSNANYVVNTLIVPREIVESRSAIPDEILSGLDQRKIVIEIMDCIYLMLESWGVNMIDPRNSRLVSDFY